MKQIQKFLLLSNDSAGFEVETSSDFLENIFEFIEDRKSKGIDEQIHIVWYFINAGTSRVETFDIKILRKLREWNIPVIILISKSDVAKQSELVDMEKTIKKYETEHDLEPFQVIRVAAAPKDGKPFGVHEIVNCTTDQLPKLYTEAFIIRQTANLEAKRKMAVGYIKVAATACFSAGFAPIPFSTPTIAIASHGILCTKISKLYGYEEWAEIIDKNSSTMMASIMATIVVSSIDITGFIANLATGFLSAAVTGSVSGGSSATFIVILGLSYISVFENLSKQDLGNKGRLEIQEQMAKEVKKKWRRFSSLRFRALRDLDSIIQYLGDDS